MRRSELCIVAWTLVLTAPLLTSCGKSRFANPFLTTASQSVQVGAGGLVSASAACKPPAKRLGGGYVVQGDPPNVGLVVRGSYPNDANGWTVEVENTTPIANDTSSVTAVAYCLERADLAPTVTVAKTGAAVAVGPLTTPGSIVRAPCPAGTVLTGGGFRVDGPLSSGDALYNAGVVGSSPEPSGWRLEAGQRLGTAAIQQRLYQVYAVCASPPLTVGAVVEQAVTSTPSDAFFEASCNADAFTTAGGFQLPGLVEAIQGRALQSVAQGEFLEWVTRTKVPGAPPAKSIVLCTPIP